MQIFCTLVGTSFRGKDAVALVATLEAGDEIELRAEPENEYDENAVACYYQDQHIGYIGRDNNSVPAQRLADEEEVLAEVATPGKKPVLLVSWS